MKLFQRASFENEEVLLKHLKLVAHVVVAAAFCACSAQSGSSSTPGATRNGSIVIQPMPVPGGGGAAGGGLPTAAPTSCAASDPTCVGPWNFGQSDGNPFDPTSYAYGGDGNGDGYWTFTIVCDGTADCADDGYPADDLLINEHWNPGSGGNDGTSAGDLGSAYGGCATTTPLGTNCTWLLTHLGAAKPGLNCEGSPKSIGGWFNGTDTQANEIYQIYEVQATAPGVQIVLGWVYQTFGAGAFFQLNLSVSGGIAAIGASTPTPSVAIPGLTAAQLVTAMNQAASAMGILSANLPPGWAKAITTSKVGASACFSPAWNGVYASSIKRSRPH